MISPNRKVLAMAWNIATEPILYRQLAPNPFTPNALQIISEKFPGVNSADVITAVIMAEPEGQYDREFNMFSKTRQQKELRKQKSDAARLNKSLVDYFAKNSKDLGRKPGDIIYDRLVKTVFGTTDTKAIEQKFSQNQRKDFKLSIIKYVGDAQKLELIRKQSGPYKRRTFLLVSSLTFSLVLLLFFAQVKIRNYLDAGREVLAVESDGQLQGFPVRLTIPSIAVDAAIEAVGVTSKGSMQVPSNTKDVAWYNLGPRPGEAGSAVIDGHFDGQDGKPAVFANLDKLKSGDIIYVDYGNGKSNSFVVRESRAFVPGYVESVFSSDSGVHLNLITCDGIWDVAKKSYSKRLVVFADLAN